MINKKNIAGILLAGIITITGTGLAFAAAFPGAGQQQADNRSTPPGTAFTQISGKLAAALDELVTSGTLTQSQEEAVLDAFSANPDGSAQDKASNSSTPASAGQKQSIPTDDLLATGIITQTQSDAIRAAVKDAQSSSISLKDALDALVMSGTISQAQEDALLSTGNVNPGTNNGPGTPGGKNEKPNSSAGQNGTPGIQGGGNGRPGMSGGQQNERPDMQGSQNSGTKMPDMPDSPLDRLVTDGTLTREQADAVQSILSSMLDSNGKPY